MKKIWTVCCLPLNSCGSDTSVIIITDPGFKQAFLSHIQTNNGQLNCEFHFNKKTSAHKGLLEVGKSHVTEGLGGLNHTVYHIARVISCIDPSLIHYSNTN